MQQLTTKMKTIEQKYREVGGANTLILPDRMGSLKSP